MAADHSLGGLGFHLLLERLLTGRGTGFRTGHRGDPLPEGLVRCAALGAVALVGALAIVCSRRLRGRSGRSWERGERAPADRVFHEQFFLRFNVEGKRIERLLRDAGLLGDAGDAGLTLARLRRYTRVMAQSFLVFDFGANEEAAQQARHRIEGWKQAFRLDKKIQLKFERKAPEKTNGGEQIRLIVRLDFSDHERLSHHRWLERIPAETPFKDAAPQVIRSGEPDFDRTAELFDSLP